MKPAEIFSASDVTCPATSSKPWGLTVRALIRDEQGRLLLLRRSSDSRFSGQWEVPGGKVESGEAFDLAIVREVAEETGLNVILKNAAGASDHEMPHIRVTNLFFEVTVIDGMLRISTEHSEAKWCESKEVAALDLAPTVRNFLLGMA